MSSKVRMLACMLALGLALTASPTQAHAEWIEFNGSRNGSWSTTPVNDQQLQPVSLPTTNYPFAFRINSPNAYTSANHVYCYLQFEFRGRSLGGMHCLLTYPTVFSWAFYGDYQQYVNRKTFLSGTPKFYYYIPGKSWVEFVPDQYGMFKVPSDGINAIRIAYDFVPSVPYSDKTATSSLYAWSQHTLLVDIPSDEAAAVYQQTTEVMDTSGSESVMDSVLSGGESALNDRLGFVGQALSIPTAFFNGITAEEDSVVHFPGISVLGFEVPATDIDIWSALPNLKTPCKTICTFVFIVAWFRGIQALYGRIVHGDKVVTVEGTD